MISKNKLVKKLQGFNCLNGFEFVEKEDGVCWKKIDDNRELSLFIGFNGYPGRYSLQTPIAFIKFQEIENKIIYFSKKLGININKADYTIKNKSLENSDFEYSVFETRIDNKHIFDKVFKAEKQYIQKSILPFFEKYQDLNNVAELLSTLKPQEVVPYIQGPKLFCKTILILKEAKHPNYKSKRDEFYEVLKKQATKKEVYAQQLQLFELLFFTRQS